MWHEEDAMQRSSFSVRQPLLVAAAVALGCALGRSTGDPVHAAPKEWKIGVVDLARVFDGYLKSKELEKKLNEEKDVLEKELEAIRAKAREIAKEMDVLDATSQAFKDLEEQKAIEATKFELYKRRMEQVLKRRIEEYNVHLVEDIESVVKVYGQEKGYSFILKSEGKAFEDNKLLLGLKAVLYYTHEIDVTDDVIDRLNKEYKAGGAFAPRPAGGAAPGASPGGQVPGAGGKSEKPK
jgi:Skp family chaperone for outer membrane proteins